MRNKKVIEVLKKLIEGVECEYQISPELEVLKNEAKRVLAQESEVDFEEEYWEEDAEAIMREEIDRYGMDVWCAHAGVTDARFAELDNITYNDAGEPLGYC